MTDPNKTQLGAPPASDPNRTIMGSVATTYEATVTIKPIQCPVCKEFNPIGVMFCVECGLIFDKALEGDAFGAPAIQLPVLVDSSGREHVIRPGENIFGRQGDIAIDDARLSRKHACLHLDGQSVTVQDMDSTNGTELNGEKLESGTKHALNSGDRLSFAGLEMTLSLPGEANKTQAPVSAKTAMMDAAPTAAKVVGWLVFGEQEIPLEFGTKKFGRKTINPIVISDPYVSSTHGEITVDDSGIYITDSGSTNGTFVNGARLVEGQRAKVSPDDEVMLGQVEITIKMKD